MHRIFTARFFNEMIQHQNKFGFFIWILLIVDLKVDNRVILHFYDEMNYKESNLYSGNSGNRCFSKFVKKKFNCYNHNICLECSQFIIENQKDFPLNFNNKDEDGSDDVIFINTKVMKFNDFVYFFNVIKEKSELKENFKVIDFLLILRIINVFKFKKDKSFSKIIRTLLLYIILNDKCFNADYNLNPKIILSSSMLKTIFIEFGKIYFFDTRFFSENSLWIEIKKKLNKNSSIDYKISTKFFCINSTFITGINKLMKFNKNFLNLFRIIFKKLKISHAILYGGNTSCQNISFHLPYLLFSNINELCFYSWNDMKFFKFMCDNSIHKNVRILTFINCNFFILSESFFDEFKFLKLIYFIDSYIANPISSDKLTTYMDLFAYFYSDITNEANNASFLELGSNIEHKFENIDTSNFLRINKRLMSAQEFKSSGYRVHSFNELTYMSSFFGLYVYVSNSQIIKRITVIFRKISLRGLTFKNLLIWNNIKELSIWNCEFSNDFLRDILLISNLKTFVIIDCKALFEKKLIYEKQSHITNFSICGSTFENSDEIIKFVKSMSNLKILDLRHNINLDMFENRYINCSMSLESLESLVLYDREKSKGGLRNISGLKNLKSFKLSNGWYGDGSLFELLTNESLSEIRDLSLYNFQIGVKDNEAMKSCEKIQELYFYSFEFINITFSELFDPKKTYIIEKLILNKIVLTIYDILFISNLFCLKYLELGIKDFLIDTKDFFKIIFLNKSQLRINMYVQKQYWREINYFKEIFKPNNQEIYEF